MEHLALEVFDRDGSGSKYAFLPSDTSITITDTSEIFDSGDIWSHAFKLNIPANAHIFGSAGEIHGSRLHEQIDKRRARLRVEGLPLYYGYLRLDDEVDVDEYGDVNVSFESGQKTFSDMIEGGKANQVPLKDDVFIGMALDRERTVYNRVFLNFGSNSLTPTPGGSGIYTIQCSIRGTQNFSQMFPKIVRPDGTWYDTETDAPFPIQKGSLINTDFPYENGHPYCNIKIGYRKQEFESNGNGFEKKPQRKMQNKEPRSFNPAPNFYMLYWLECLMKHLGIFIEENGMTEVEDLKRLFFVNTKCAYKTKDDGVYRDRTYQNRNNREIYLPLGFEKPYIPFDAPEDDPKYKFDEIEPVTENVPSDLKVGIMSINIDSYTNDYNPIIRATWHKAYATSENFPDTGIKDVIESLENGFGVRFLFNNDYTKVRVVLLRDILRSQVVHEVPCEVLEITKEESSIRGFRLTYGAGEDNTNYFYRGFANKLTHKAERWSDTSDTHDYSQWDMSLHYGDIKGRVGMLNKTCYIDSATGNAYIVKIDEDWKNASDEAFPSLFSCADFMDAEDGDCTGEEETIKEVRIGFTPMIVNALTKDDSGVENDGYTLFVDEEMGVPCDDDITMDTTSAEIGRKYTEGIVNTHGFVSVKDEPKYHKGLFSIATSTTFEAYVAGGLPVDNQIAIPLRAGGYCYVKVHGTIKDGYLLYLQDNYDPNDDLTIPIEEHDWGLTLGIMRGSGSDAYLREYDDPDDDENDAWEWVSGSGAYAHPDTCDDNGQVWDYGGRTDYNAVCTTPADAIEAMQAIWGGESKPHNFYITSRSSSNYLTGYLLQTVEDNQGKAHVLLLAAATKDQSPMPWTALSQQYINGLNGKSVEQMISLDSQNANVIIEIDSSREKGQTLLRLQKLAYDNGEPVTVSGGVDVREGRFSLKLRAEKPNPYFDPTQPESQSNSKYLEITNPALQRRGLADQFYKEYSYWVRNARIAKMEVRIELAQLLAIDKTKRVRIGDITGFVKEMQYSVDIQSGMSNVMIEIWYL